MKYFCIGNKIALVKLQRSTNFFDNLPITGTPVFGKLPVTQAKMRDVFEQSEKFIFCKNMEDANKLRHSNIRVGNTNVTPEFYKGAIAQGYPLSDYAIYEVEVENNIDGKFVHLNNMTEKQLKELEFFDADILLYFGNDKSVLPSIEICSVKKSEINIRLLSCHYLSLIDNSEEVDNQNRCAVS